MADIKPIGGIEDLTPTIAEATWLGQTNAALQRMVARCQVPVPGPGPVAQRSDWVLLQEVPPTTAAVFILSDYFMNLAAKQAISRYQQ